MNIACLFANHVCYLEFGATRNRTKDLSIPKRAVYYGDFVENKKLDH